MISNRIKTGLTRYSAAISLLAVLLTGCSGSGTQSGGQGGGQGGAGLKGWELNETNIGLRGDYSKLTEFDLNGEDAGKGEWIGGEGGYLRIKGNQTIENKIFTYTKDLRAPEGGTVFKNCLFRPTALQAGMYFVEIINGVIQDSEVSGELLGTDFAHNCISLENGSALRNNLHHCDAGIMASNTDGATLIDQNYIHDVLFTEGTNDHCAGISIWEATGNGFVISNNRILMDDEAVRLHTTSAFFSQPLNGDILNVSITGNLFESSSYVIHLTGSSHTFLPYSIVDNRLTLLPCRNASDENCAFGYFATNTVTPEWSENYVYDASAPDAKGTIIDVP